MPGASVPGARGTSLPGDWDGGWRHTSPPTLTVARAPLGVSDGLTFRAGLASWQNPSFDAGLGHAVLPSAPVGLVHGVTGPPATGATYADGGPLLLRALRTDAGEGEGSSSVAEPGAAAAVRTPTLRARTAPAAAPNRGDDKGSGTADRPRTSVPSGTAGPDRTGQTPAGDAPSVQRSVAAPAPGRALVASDPLVPTAAPTAQVQRTERPGAASDAGVVRPDDPARLGAGTGDSGGAAHRRGAGRLRGSCRPPYRTGGRTPRIAGTGGEHPRAPDGSRPPADRRPARGRAGTTDHRAATHRPAGRGEHSPCRPHGRDTRIRPGGVSRVHTRRPDIRCATRRHPRTPRQQAAAGRAHARTPFLGRSVGGGRHGHDSAG
ncbi:hypothetical protein ACQ4WX_07630 [Streptomyces lasalocidi]